MSSIKDNLAIALLVQRLLGDERGENVVEYAMILGFISLLIVGAAIQLGLSFEGLWESISKSLAGAMPFEG